MPETKLPYPANLRAERDKALDLARELYKALKVENGGAKGGQAGRALARYKREVGDA